MATSPMSLAQFGQTVKAKHPEYSDLADEDVANRVLAKYPEYKDMVSTQPPAPAQQPSTLQAAGDAIKNFGIGALKGAGSTANNLGHILYPDFIAKHLTGAPSQQQQQEYFAPQGTAQTIGKGVEQAAEFLAPVGVEGKVAGKVADLVPQLGRFAKPAARVAASALSTGAVNKAQGGSFSGGAVMGGAGGVLGEGLRAAAPIVAESALGIKNVDRRAPITPGRAILDETSGIRPRSIADQASGKMTGYTNQRDALLAAAPDVDLTATRQSIADAQNVAARRNNADTIKRIGQAHDQLHYEGAKPPVSQPAPPKVIPGFGPSVAAKPPAPTGIIPASVPATRANALKQGLGDLPKTWNPATPNTFAEGAIKNAYGTLDKSIDAAAPGTGALNEKISALVPVAERANATDLNASALQRILGRFTRPTGALVGMTGGFLSGGVPGAAIGLAAPEVIGSPSVQMLMARRFSAGMTPTVRSLTGGTLGATRKSLYSAPNQ